MRTVGILGLLLSLSWPVQALDLQMPANATLAREVTRAADTILLPTGPFAQGTLPRRRLAGEITQRAWHLPTSSLTTLQVLLPLRAELETSGWSVDFECADMECGGFDFRFNTPVLPAPDMFVDLFDYRYLYARRGAGAEGEHATLLISRTGQTGYVQITHVRPLSDSGTTEPVRALAPVEPELELGERLLEQGYATLADLDFGSGAGQLGVGPYASLAALVAFLLADSGHRVALVGHSDSVGGFDNNVALSRSRAEAVRDRLVNEYGVPPAQIEAHGIGYLAPVASNRTAGGRERNRRVEVVLLDTQ
ncbi:OmpA-OmpF porin, OOP family [Roseovarius azorensis]|uniref:OmpA-OmpF porin, OOP family n=1 Tax=Roseovarius azorensis TaxID=1287727 RepID=A0A1H7FGJ4_9RHOB|nr:OmpA family protein [Roseovarius azorensis]SEK25253.1 OmpA-OmpF porin, OOP family [Roseovarius azorensis]